MAHEMGHNFGASHDLRSNCGGSGGYSGYLMAPTAPVFGSAMSRRFSQCSLDAIEGTLREMERGSRDWCFVKGEEEEEEKGGGLIGGQKVHERNAIANDFS